MIIIHKCKNCSDLNYLLQYYFFKAKKYIRKNNLYHYLNKYRMNKSSKKEYICADIKINRNVFNSSSNNNK